jgi:hypothetical protein
MCDPSSRFRISTDSTLVLDRLAEMLIDGSITPMQAVAEAENRFPKDFVSNYNSWMDYLQRKVDYHIAYR